MKEYLIKIWNHLIGRTSSDSAESKNSLFSTQGGEEFLPSIRESKNFKDAFLIPFSEAIDICKFTGELTEAIEDEFPKRMLAPLGIQASDLGIKLGHKLAKYSSEVAKGIRTGNLTPLVTKQGRELLEVITTGKGAFAGKAFVANGAKAASVAASGAGIAIQVAYIFSSMDTLRRLQSLDRKTGLLLAARKFDQLGRLERIYTHAGELLHMGVPLDLVANDIHRLASELTELRSVWRQEVRNKIQERNPEKIENDWYFGFGDSKRTKKLIKEMEEFDPLHAEIHLIRFSFVLQWALMASIGRESTFGRITCNGEQNEWRDLAALIERKAEIIDARVLDQPRRATELADAVWEVKKLCKDLGLVGTPDSGKITYQPKS
jgi:hypothetical protein